MHLSQAAIGLLMADMFAGNNHNYKVSIMCNRIEKNFIWIIVSIVLLALIVPSMFTWLRPYLTTLLGIIIFGIGSCPGGAAANVMSYLSRGNVALTVMLTFGTTLLAPIAMPALVYYFLHNINHSNQLSYRLHHLSITKKGNDISCVGIDIRNLVKHIRIFYRLNHIQIIKFRHD